jgi:hypothetical protein
MAALTRLSAVLLGQPQAERAVGIAEPESEGIAMGKNLRIEHAPKKEDERCDSKYKRRKYPFCSRYFFRQNKATLMS